MTEAEPDVVVTWPQDDTMVRWSGPAGKVEKVYELVPRAVMAWREYDETLVLGSLPARSASISSRTASS